MCYGKNKSENVVIPYKLIKTWNLLKYTLRGIVDTDGSIFVSDKRGSPQYPSLEITTSSYILAVQLRTVLLERGFRVANIWRYKSKNSRKTTFKVPLNGKENIRKWVKEIGFSNPYKMKRAINALN